MEVASNDPIKRNGFRLQPVSISIICYTN